MKILTIVHNEPETFDNLVNNALEDGYILGRRGPEPIGDGAVKLYAELVKLDEPEDLPEAQPGDPMELIRQLRDFCAGSKCDTCPLENWCPVWLPRNEGPADWELPDEETGL